jgi:hypothetical protein
MVQAIDASSMPVNINLVKSVAYHKLHHLAVLERGWVAPEEGPNSQSYHWYGGPNPNHKNLASPLAFRVRARLGVH